MAIKAWRMVPYRYITVLGMGTPTSHLPAMLRITESASHTNSQLVSIQRPGWASSEPAAQVSASQPGDAATVGAKAHVPVARTAVLLAGASHVPRRYRE